MLNKYTLGEKYIYIPQIVFLEKLLLLLHDI